MSPVPVPASLRLSDEADAYLSNFVRNPQKGHVVEDEVEDVTFNTSHVVSDLSDRTSSYAWLISGSERRSAA
jgi:hypothetical protein